MKRQVPDSGLIQIQDHVKAIDFAYPFAIIVCVNECGKI